MTTQQQIALCLSPPLSDLEATRQAPPLSDALGQQPKRLSGAAQAPGAEEEEASRDASSEPRQAYKYEPFDIEQVLSLKKDCG